VRDLRTGSGRWPPLRHAVVLVIVNAATLRAVTPCRVAVVPGDRIQRAMLEQVASHRRDQITA
jgi:hypothetical protein